MDDARQKRLDEVSDVAVDIELDLTSFPASFPPHAVVAQWAVESDWGTKPVGHANYFGIKRAARHILWVDVTTHEVVKGQRVEVVAQFADYPDLSSSCRDYAWLISHGDPYKRVWSNYLSDWNVVRLMQGIASIYATDPLYSKLVTQIVQQPNVVAAVNSSRRRRAPGLTT